MPGEGLSSKNKTLGSKQLQQHRVPTISRSVNLDSGGKCCELTVDGTRTWGGGGYFVDLDVVPIGRAPIKAEKKGK